MYLQLIYKYFKLTPLTLSLSVSFSLIPLVERAG